jgi:UDP-N-acetylglucosamine--N-acetylmuramyl-(pentapeptide) pyrophosphoryl-undecaprenol N-acetylglucosamine transferase
MTKSVSKIHLKPKELTALVMAGGTGGHIFPGLAVAQELIARGWKIHWLGSKGGMEETLVARQNIPMSLIAISGLRGNGLLGWVKAPFSLIKAVLEARRVITKVSPQVVLGFGGFASGPGGLAAKLAGRFLIVHEQNAIAGLTNKMLSKFANRVFQAFPNTFDKNINAQTVGNPIRKDITKLSSNGGEELTLESQAMTSNKVIQVLVIGGSRGAQALNQQLPPIFSEQLKSGKIQVRHQSGEAGYQDACAAYGNVELNNQESVKVEKFIDDMSSAYQWADIVVCRSGALTVSEIAAVGKAAIFIPFPFAVDDHQTMNANWLVEQGAGIVIPQSLLSSDESVNKIKALLADSSKIAEMANKAKRTAYLQATEKMVQACEESVEMAA